MPEPEQRRSTASAPFLFERQREVATIETLLDHIATSRGGHVLVEGPAGIGKSRLLQEAGALARRRDIRVLTARGSQLEQEFAFGVVRQLFEPVLADPAVSAQLLGGAASAAGAVLRAPADGPAQAGDASFAALHALYWLAVNLSAGAPVLLAVDDLHWADRSSLHFLAYVVRRIDGLPLGLATSIRPAEPGQDPISIAELASDPLTARISPRPLTVDGAAGVIADALSADPDEGFTEACWSSTGGNPLLLRELVRALQAEGVPPSAGNSGMVSVIGPAAVSRAVLLRLSRLPGPAAVVARAAAVLGDPSDVPAVATVAGVDETAAAGAIDALARAEILSPDAAVGFVHPLVRDAIYLDVPPGERDALHARAARHLAEAAATSERVAAHLLLVPRRGDPWAVEHLLVAAAAASARGAPEGAAAYLKRALEEPPPADRRAGVLVDLGIALAQTSGRDAVGYLSEGLWTLDDPIRRTDLAMFLMRLLYFTGDLGTAAAVGRRAIAELPDGHDDLRLEAQAVLASISAFDESVVALDGPETRAIQGEVFGDGPGGRLAAGVSAYMRTMRGEPCEAAVAEALHAVGEGVLVRRRLAGPSVIGSVTVLVLADRPEGLAAVDALVAAAYERGSLYQASVAHTFRGWARMRAGDLEQAEEDLRLGLDQNRRWGFGSLTPHPAAYLVSTLVARGDVRAARDTFEAADVPPDPPPGRTPLSWWFLARAELLLAEGRLDDAAAAALEIDRRFGHSVRNPSWLHWRSLLAQALDGLGRADEAIGHVEAELDAARSWGAPGAIGRSLRVAGVLRRADGLDELAESVAVLEASPARYELTQSLLALGRALRLARRPTDAREPLRRALDLAEACGTPAAAGAARAELEATGERVATGAGGAVRLTPSERRVAELAAGGQTNRQIAQALYVTPKTVEVHLSSAYRKLGITSRQHLQAALRP